METIQRQNRDASIAQSTIDEVVQAIVDRFSPETILLFGSYAAGTPTPDSDLDLLVVMDSDLPRHRRPAQIRLLFQSIPCSMDIKVYTPEEVAHWKGTVNHIITEAFQSGRIVYER